MLILDAARAGQRLVAGGERGYILISDDDGKSWRHAQSPASATLTALYFVDDRHGWAVGHDAVIVRSEDGGASWQRTHFAADEQKPLLDVWFRDADRGFAVGAYGLFLESDDGGKSWKPKAAFDGDFHINALAAGRDGKLLIAGEGGALYRSDDYGQSWEKIESPYAGSFFGALATNDGSFIVYGLRGNAFRSEDFGASWNEIKTGGEASLMGGAAWNDDVVLVGNDGTVLVSHDDGKTFRARKAGAGSLAAVVRAGDGSLLVFGEAGVTRLGIDRQEAKP